jgi:hypothetical protein
MHDVASFERRGLPSVALLTDTFRIQASYQARKLGLEASARVFVPHPVIDPLAPVATKAAAIIEDIITALTSDELPACTAASAGASDEDADDAVTSVAECSS